MSRKGENIYKRKDGRWEGRYIKSRTASGKAIYGYIYAKTYKEAKEKVSIQRMLQSIPRVQKRRFSSKGGVRAFWEPGFSKPVKKSIKDVKSVTLASSDLPRRETTRGTIAYRKNRKLGKPSTHD